MHQSYLMYAPRDPHDGPGPRLTAAVSAAGRRFVASRPGVDHRLARPTAAAAWHGRACSEAMHWSIRDRHPSREPTTSLAAFERTAVELETRVRSLLEVIEHTIRTQEVIEHG